MRSVYISTPGGNMAKTVGVKNYMGIVGFPVFTTTLANNRVVFPKNCGTVKVYHLEVDNSPSGLPGEGNGWEFRLVKNGVAQEGTKITIEGATVKGEWNGELTFEEGDTLSWEVIAIGGEAASSLGSSSALAVFMETAGKISFIFGMSTTALGTANGTKYQHPYGVGGTAWQEGEGSVRGIVPVPLKVIGYTVLQSGASGAGKSLTHFLRKNQSEDKMEINVEGGSAVSGSSGTSFECAAGDRLELKATLAGTPNSRNVAWGIAVEPTTNVAVSMGCQVEAPNPAGTVVQFPTGPRLNTWGTGSANRVVWPTSATDLANLFSEVHVAPGEGKEWETGITVNSVASALVASVTGAATTGKDTTHTVTTGAAARLQYRMKGISTPAADTGGAHWGFTVAIPQPTNWVIEVNDSVSLADSVSKGVGKPVADSVSLADAASKGVGKSVADTVTLSDSVSKGVSKLVADTVGLADAVAKAVAKTIADTAPLADAVETIIEGAIALFTPPDDEGYFPHDALVPFASSSGAASSVSSTGAAAGASSTSEVLLEPDDDADGPHEAASDALIDFIPSEGTKP